MSHLSRLENTVYVVYGNNIEYDMIYNIKYNIIIVMISYYQCIRF